MWNMYATFEDLISGSPKSEKPNEFIRMVEEMSLVDNGNEKESEKSLELTTFKTNADNVAKESSVVQLKLSTKPVIKEAPESCPKEDETDNQAEEEECKIGSCTNERLTVKSAVLSRKLRNMAGNQSDSGSSSSIANPLLDTISSLTSSDPYSDSDDCSDINGKVVYQRERRRCRRVISERNMKKSPNHHQSSSDADSIGYAGSNSIDSGYKSQCPTPDISDGNASLCPVEIVEIHHNPSRCKLEKGQNTQVQAVPEAKDVVKEKQQQPQPSASGTTTTTTTQIADESHKTVKTSAATPSPLKSPSVRSSIKSSARGGLYNAKIATRLKSQSVNAHLEHLLHLRESLISAIHKCESVTSTPPTSRVASPVISSRSSSPASNAIGRNGSLLSNGTNSPCAAVLCNSRFSHITKSKQCLSSTTGSSHEAVARQLILSPKSHRKHCHFSPSDRKCALNSSISSSVSSSSSSLNNKSVRFDNDVKVTALHSLYSQTPTSRSSFRARASSTSTITSATSINTENTGLGNSVGPQVHNGGKSILKDPLCANLRSQLQSGELGSGCSLEGEIDTLLYGKSSSSSSKVDLNREQGPVYELDGGQEIPYVTLIEDKYRLKQGGSSSSKLKDAPLGFSPALETAQHFDDLDVITTAELSINATLSTKTRERLSSGTNLGEKRKLSKSKFSEMARCMLAILDDLHMKKSGGLTSSKTSRKNIEEDTKYMSKSKQLMLLYELGESRRSVGSSRSVQSDTLSESSYGTLPEYHIYEEVMYDYMDSLRRGEGDGKEDWDETMMERPLQRPGPPQVPELNFSTPSNDKFSDSGSLDLGSANRRVFTSLKSNQCSASWGRSSNRPKQRSNLYSLFADPSQRQNISRSLEREWSCYRAGLMQDSLVKTTEVASSEYGFKASV